MRLTALASVHVCPQVLIPAGCTESSQEEENEMKRSALGITVGVVLALSMVPRVEGSSLLRITVSGTTVNCSNETAAGVSACAAAGFSTVLNGNAISFSGTINGVLFGIPGSSTLSKFGNVPGAASQAFILGGGTAVNNSGAARTITIDFATNNFTQPVGTGSLLISQTANWTISGGGDSQAFSAWQQHAYCPRC
jgi:hypothetical protein